MNYIYNKRMVKMTSTKTKKVSSGKPKTTKKRVKKDVVKGEVETPVVETPVVETPVVETPVVETPVVETPVVETPVVETPVVETPVVETPLVEGVEPVLITKESIKENFSKLEENLKNQTNELREKKNKKENVNIGELIKQNKKIMEEVKQLSKNTQKLLKQKRKNKTGNSNSGFKKPVEITDDLAKFLKIKEGSLLSRVEVTKNLTNYIKENKLQTSENKRKIFPDKTLSGLFSKHKNEYKENGYFEWKDMQKYMQVHFVKK